MNQGNFSGLMPIIVFLLLFIGSGIIANSFYALPTIVAFLIALVIAFLQNRRLNFNQKLAVVAKSMGNENIMIMCLIFILAGVVVGGLLGELASRVDFLWWLGYGNSFGLSEPLVLDLSIIKITFALVIKVNIASIIGVLLAILIYRKV